MGERIEPADKGQSYVPYYLNLFVPSRVRTHAYRIRYCWSRHDAQNDPAGHETKKGAHKVARAP